MWAQILGYEYRNRPFHFAAVNLSYFCGGNMLCERESAKACWKISFQPLKIPRKDKKWVTSIGFWIRQLWRQNLNSNLYVGISNKSLPAIFENFAHEICLAYNRPFLTGLVKNTPAGYFLLWPTLTDNLLFLAHSHKFFSPLLLPTTAASGLTAPALGLQSSPLYSLPWQNE